MKEINITNIIMDSHELHSERGRWSIPKTPWVERVFCSTPVLTPLALNVYDVYIVINHCVELKARSLTLI